MDPPLFDHFEAIATQNRMPINPSNPTDYALHRDWCPKSLKPVQFIILAHVPEVIPIHFIHFEGFQIFDFIAICTPKFSVAVYRIGRSKILYFLITFPRHRAPMPTFLQIQRDFRVPEPTEKPRRGLPLGLPCLSPLYFCSIFEGLHRTIRPKLKIFSCMRSASVDLVRSRLSLVDFSSGLAVPSENIDFQHLETQKTQLFQTFSNFSRHGSCGYATKLQKQRKIRIWARNVQFATQLTAKQASRVEAIDASMPKRCKGR